ncbi:DUF6596 domain-containing protein [Nocardia nova]|uniref:DUF6596 domain-containing protein n=1 Tax=Nocardia nova TaxID=37330 RepID=UPI00379B88E3
MNESLLRELVPAVIGVLVRRGADFASAEDAVQEALIRALEIWPDDPPRDPMAGLPLDRPGDPATVLRVLYLVFNEGYSGDIDLAAEAIRLTRRLAAATDEPEVAGLLALMLLHHARRATRTGPGGRLVPLAQQDRTRWDTTLITEGVAILQAALARDRLGEYQAQAAIAAVHADAPTAAETDWVQIVEWYDELLNLTGSPVVQLNRAVAVGEADGPQAGLAELSKVDPGLPRYDAVHAYLLERAGDLEQAADLYAAASATATSVPERDHLSREAARVRSLLRRRPDRPATSTE